MAKQPDRQQVPTQPGQLPAGVELTRTLPCDLGRVWGLAFDPGGEFLAAASFPHTFEQTGSGKLWDVKYWQVRGTFKPESASIAFDPSGGRLALSGRGEIFLWDVRSGDQIASLPGHPHERVVALAFDPTGTTLASAGFDGDVKLWDAKSERLLRTFEGHQDWVWSIAFDPKGKILASASDDASIRLWNVASGEPINVLRGHSGRIFAVAFDLRGEVLASGGGDRTVRLWDPATGRLLRTLEGHTEGVTEVAFSPDAQLLASRGKDDSIRLWSCRTWDTIAVIPAAPTASVWGSAGLAFHPDLPLLAAAVGSDGGDGEVRVWTLDLDELLSLRAVAPPSISAVHHATSKIVLLGDHSVGKSALAHRLIHGDFKEQASTHGQQFWVFPDLGERRADGTDCEAILWDLAGQPDYRLVHALFLDNADLALVLFDSSDIHDPLHGVSFWLKQLQAVRSRCGVILVAAQVDRGTCSLTPEELASFCEREGIAGPIATSALTHEGITELVACMRSMIAWEDKPATVTTTTFKRIKDYVLSLKEAGAEDITLVTAEELRARLEGTNDSWEFSDNEMAAAIGHLENYGYVKRLHTSTGQNRILLHPELLNNLASSFVLEARKHPKGLGALEERRLLADGYDFAELRHLQKAEREVLLDSAALLFLEHNVCFRETDPLRMEPYLVFPELINLKKPPEDEPATDEGVAYTVNGPTENVFASLVVLLGYTHTFTRTAQWHENARYEMGEKLVCAFKQEAERDGELDFVLSFGANVGAPVRTLFQGLFESLLARRNLTVMRYEPVQCTNSLCGHLLDRSVVRQRLKEGKPFAFCNDCGEKLILPKMEEPIQLTREVQAEVDLQRRAAEERTRFEQAIFRIRTYTSEQEIRAPETFISYAWGVPEHERWVEKRLATDLLKAGIGVVLDRWHNARIGANVARFVERIEKSDRIVMVGTPGYRRKYENRDEGAGYVVAAEVDLINNRLIGTEPQKQSVLPLLLNGERAESLPPLLHGRVYADFRDELAYFATAFELIVSLYDLPETLPLVTDLREMVGMKTAA